MLIQSLQTALQRRGKSALDSQAISRVWYELDRAAPKLGELAGLLEGVNMKADDVPRVQSYLANIQGLASQLEHMILHPDLHPSTSFVPPVSSTQPVSHAPQHPPGMCSILPPSPEKRQKRKDSYSVH
jgi:hypothetical protein